MRLKNLKYMGLIVASLSLASCDDFLTQNDPTRTSTDNYWENLDDTEGGLIATYAVLRNNYLTCVIEDCWRSDLGWPGYGRPAPTQNNSGWLWYTQNYTHSDNSLTKRWDASYQCIFRANQVIEALEKIKSQAGVDEGERINQMAQARFMRGLMYFYLHSDFNKGSVVLHKSVPRTTADYNKPLSPAEDVLEFYRADLEYAYDNLAPKHTSEKNIGRPTAGSAATILGLSYMYAKELDKAEPYFQDVIENPSYGYMLEQDLNKMFKKDGDFNSESILEISYTTEWTNGVTSVWDENIMSSRLNSMLSNTVGALLPSWLAYQYKSEPIDPQDPRNLIDGKLRKVSLRASTMVTLVEDEDTPYYQKWNVSEKENFGGPGGEWGCGKYKKYSNSDWMDAERELISGKNVILNRLSDVYLLYAECLLARNDIDGALKYINEVRKRWGLVLLGYKVEAGRTYDEKGYTADELMQHLMYIERPLELAAEGHSIRWNDLRRWGMLKERFDELSNDSYFFSSILITKLSDGKTQWRANCSVKKDASLATGNDHVVDYEYDAAASNYTEANEYLPIPLKEIMNNSSIN